MGLKDTEIAKQAIEIADLQDRIVAKDQTIRSLESQVDYLRAKLNEQKPT